MTCGQATRLWTLVQQPGSTEELVAGDLVINHIEVCGRDLIVLAPALRTDNLGMGDGSCGRRGLTHRPDKLKLPACNDPLERRLHDRGLRGPPHLYPLCLRPDEAQ